MGVLFMSIDALGFCHGGIWSVLKRLMPEKTQQVDQIIK